MRTTSLYQNGLLLFLAVWLGGCASLGEKQTLKVELQQDASISEAGGQTIVRKKGDSFEVTERPALVESPGYLSALVIPVHSTVGTATLALPRAQSSGATLDLQKVYDSMNHLLSEFNDAQILLAADRAGEALRVADELITKYPQLPHLKFFKASCLVVEGRRDEARQLLEEGLRDFPEDKVGRDLYNALTHGKKE